MLPDNTLASQSVESFLLSPDNINRINRKVDFEIGPIALNDVTSGVMFQNWKAWIEDNGTKVFCAPESNLANKTLLVTDVGISEISLTFDQLARPQLAYMAGTMCKLWWYNSETASQVTTEFPGVVSPMVSLDDKRQSSTGASDIIFAYCKAGNLYYRQQRDRYLIERDLGPTPFGSNRISSMGMGSNYRFVFTFAKLA